MLLVGGRRSQKHLLGPAESQALDVPQFHQCLIGEVGFVYDFHLHLDAQTQV